jgi:hypothetical protein
MATAGRELVLRLQPKGLRRLGLALPLVRLEVSYFLRSLRAAVDEPP